MVKYVVAVSGGVDSVVLLDAICRKRQVARQQLPTGEVIVAHFDHGIRSDSADDAVFVKTLADQYEVEYVSRREELGANASEETARTRRYAFLYEVCAQHNAVLMTAHHADDAVETVAINLTRGTGWRGLAVFDNSQILRPLVSVTKDEILAYARQYTLEWREDSTNASDTYLRNRIRATLRGQSEDNKRQILALRARQAELKRMIDAETNSLIGTSPYSRYFYGHCGDDVALELLRALFISATGRSPAKESRARALHAIKTAHPDRAIHVADGITLRFTKRDFIVESTL